MGLVTVAVKGLFDEEGVSCLVYKLFSLFLSILVTYSIICLTS